MTFVNFNFGLQILIVNTILLNLVTGNVSPATTTVSPPKSCYAMAVYNELIKVIDTLNARTRHLVPERVTVSNQNVHVHSHVPNLKKLQDEEDEPSITDIVDGGELAAILPMIFKVVGSALSLNSSGIAENSLGVIPPGLSNQITNVLGSLANNILGVPPPKNPPRPPPIRRRRRTTTTENIMNLDQNTTMSLIVVDPIDATNSTTFFTPLLEEKDNTTTVSPLTEELKTEPTSTTVKALFPESFLGEIPVYAAAYAPNYIQTTSYPVYASNFLHILYPAPTTVPTTSTSSNTESLYAIALPFESPDESKSSTMSINKEELLNTTPDEYEYEEATDNKLRENMEVSARRDLLAAEVSSTVKAGAVMVEDEDDEYLDKDANTNRSLGRVGRIF